MKKQKVNISHHMDESWGNTFIIKAAVYIRINRLT